MKYFLIFGSILVLTITVATVLYLPSYLEKQQKIRDNSYGCIKYSLMLEQSLESYQMNPNGSKWKRESMAAAGLLTKHRCTPKE